MDRKWLGVILLVVLGLFGMGAWKLMSSYVQTGSSSQSGSQQGSQATASRDAVKISIASSNTKQDWLHQAADAFNQAARSNSEYQVNGKPVFVDIIQETVDGKKVDYRSGTMVTDTLKKKIQPTVLSPGEEAWLIKFRKEWEIQNGSPAMKGGASVLVRTPLVIAMWQSRAKAMGCFPAVGPNCTWQNLRALAANPDGWKMFGRPEWGKFTFGYGYFGESNSGTLGIVSMCMVGARKTKVFALTDANVDGGCGKFVKDIESAKVHSGKSDIWLLEKMIKGGPEYLNAVITYESNVVLMNKKHAGNLPEQLVAVYPQDGTIVVGHPYAVLDSVPWVTPEQVQAARVFEKFLTSKEQQEAVLAVGLRPADPGVKLGNPIGPEYGANPHAKLALLEVPETLIMDRIGEVWHAVKKRAVVVLLFDKSGSMSDGGKIAAARAGAIEFVKSMGLDDYIIWMPFDATIYSSSTRGTKSEVGERLVEEIRNIPAGGGTALYDGVIIAMDQLSELRKKFGDTVRYGIVILSDGDDTARRSTLTMVQEKLKPEETNPHGVQVHSVCIGSDCVEQVLKKIAAAANGKYAKGNTAEEMVRIYKDIATHY